MVCMTTILLGVLQVITQHRPIVWMCDLDEFLSLLHGALATQVGHAIFGDNGIYEMTSVVNVAGKRHNAGDCATLCS